MDDSHKVGKDITDYSDKNGKPIVATKEVNTKVGKDDEPPMVEKLVVSRRVEK